MSTTSAGTPQNLKRKESAETPHTPFPDDHPSPHPVDAKAVLDRLADIVRKTVILNPHQVTAVTLHVALTYFTEHVTTLPLLMVTAPEKACGKSRLLDVISRLASRPLMTSNLTAAFLVRAINLWSPTLLIDELDTFASGKDELAGIINAGHTRASAFVGRVATRGDDFVPEFLSVFCAKVVAGINLLKLMPSATISR